MRDAVLIRRFASIAAVVIFSSAAVTLSLYADESSFRTTVAPLLETYCLGCHNAETTKGEVSFEGYLEEPAADFNVDDDAKLWRRVLEQLSLETMPPKKAKKRPDKKGRASAVRWLNAALAKNVKLEPGLRRLNRREYEHTLQDLLGIDTPLAELLPSDGTVSGFDNVASGLGISSILFEKYLQAADVAFDASIRRIKPSPPATRRSVLMEGKHNIDSVKGKKGGTISEHGAFIKFTPGWPGARIDEAHPIEPGIYRCRIAVWPHKPSERTLSVAVFTGELFNADKTRYVGVFDVTGTPEKPRIIEFTTRLEANHALHILPWIYPEHVTWRDKHEPRPGVGIVWAETYGPLDQEFPSKSQERIFGAGEGVHLVEGDRANLRRRRDAKKHRVESKSPREDISKILNAFVPRAVRRPVDESLSQQFVDLALSRLDSGSSFEDSVRAGVTAVLCSPHFLLLNRETTVDDYTIASRLSYFLWSSMPDAELLRLASEGELRKPEVRSAQIERMIRDPKIERFVDSFTDQWLSLRDIELTTPDKKLYPEFDELLQRSLAAETRAFFRHILENDLSVLNFVDSDFALLNERLARHYGIEGVRGHEKMRVVSLPDDSIRGGVLTHASVLKVTANGTNTSPVTRGVWVLDRILGQAPRPPPSGVPAVEPDIRGATTLREMLAKHRADDSCASCHASIDPPGFALEEFNAIGGVREWYRTLGGRGKKVDKTSYRIGPPVDPSGEFADGRSFQNFVEFRRQLLAKPDSIVRAIAEKLLIYGAGRPVTVADQRSVEAVTQHAKKHGLGLRSMIHAVVESELFHRP